MKKVLLTLATAAIVLSSCGTMGFGTSMGAMVGGTLGSIAGDAAGGWHGSSIGGMVSSIAGMAVGAATICVIFSARQCNGEYRTRQLYIL